MNNQYKLGIYVFLISFTAFWANTISADVCWKSTYGRGVGTIPGTCKPQQTKSGLLCYPECKPGFHNVAGVCWKSCPENFKDTGAHCLKPGSYGRGAGYVLWNRKKCEEDHKPRFIEGRRVPVVYEEGATYCEKSGLLWYPKCKAGFHAVGCCVCSPNCPEETRDIGVSCQKNSYVVPPITPNCGDKQYDAGLCYKNCKAGYYGVGPVCWGRCPSDKPVDCGAMCGTSAGDCLSSIGEMVLSVGQVVAKVAETILTFGAATGISAALDIAKEGAINTIKDVAKKAAVAAAKAGAGAVNQQLQAKGLPPEIASKLASMTTDPDNFDYAGFLKGLDPSGITNVVDAFNKKICPVASPTTGAEVVDEPAAPPVAAAPAGVTDRIMATVCISNQCLTSQNKLYEACQQDDGNFVIYSNLSGKRVPIWAINKIEKNSKLCMQDDGNLVTYAADRAYWSTDTYGKGSSYLVMQGDGNLVVYDANDQPTWASNTVGK